MSIKYSYNYVKDKIKSKGYALLVKEYEFKGVTKTPLICKDDNGYKYIVCFNELLRDKKPRAVIKSNPFAIENINTYLKNQSLDFVCISNSYVGKKSTLVFKCERCGEIVKKNWDSINRKGESRTHIQCPNCDGRKESLHAIVLKQIFKHEYPDTIEEEKSCVNPHTNKIMPTDIVNHRLKIAIEIQSQWHDYPETKIKDEIKRNFWINNGYKFYALDIRDYSILEMCNVFFDIDEIPDYIRYDYNSKLNIKKIQEMLNDNVGVHDIAKKIDVNPHRIYDAIGRKQLKYPKTYINKSKSPVVKYDLKNNIIERYDSIKDAGISNNIDEKRLSSLLRLNRNVFDGYVLKYERDCV